MARSNRLLELLQLLRHYRYPVSAQVLATTLQISVRTLYRDIATLQQQGADIEGEAGVGYLLRPGFIGFYRRFSKFLVSGGNFMRLIRHPDMAIAGRPVGTTETSVHKACKRAESDNANGQNKTK